MEEEEVKIVRESEVGVLPTSKFKLDILVIAEGWPSWSFAFQGLGFGQVSTRLVNTSLSVTHSFMKTRGCLIWKSEA